MTTATSQQTKLTLRLDQSLIEGAKRYAAEHGSSVSQLVADYFVAFSARPEKRVPKRDDWLQELDPMTRKLVGAAVPKAGDGALQEDDYKAHLRRKHLGAQ